MARSLGQQVAGLRSRLLPKAAELLEQFEHTYSVNCGQLPSRHLGDLVAFYNRLGLEKVDLGLSGNDLRNTVGVAFEDYLINLLLEVTQGYPSLDVFSQVRTLFGQYTLWEQGRLRNVMPSEVSDIGVGYIVSGGMPIERAGRWPRPIVRALEHGQSLMPVVLVSSKVRVSQPEFFDWLGRSQLIAKGHPHCLSIQVALRREMDLALIEVAQSTNQWFLLGEGGEGRVEAREPGLVHMLQEIREHLEHRMA